MLLVLGMTEGPREDITYIENKMAYSNLNFVSPKKLKSVFGLSDGKFTMLAVEGKFKFMRKYKNPLVYMDSIASLYEDRSTYVLKRWDYDYESVKDKYDQMMTSSCVYKGLPRCFFRVNDVPEAYYRVFYRGEAMKLCVYVFDGILRCICFDRTREYQLENLFFAFEQGNVDIEG